jgi:lantibiotic modifying enzyme
VLYLPEAFEPLTDGPWDADRVRAAIGALAADVEAAFDPASLWPAEGDWDGWRTPTPLKTLYVGAAGVVWALEALRRRGHAETTLDLAAAALRALEAFRAEPDFMAGVELPSTAAAGLMSGESGILAVALRLGPSRDLADALHARVRENAVSEACDLMWGAPGTLLAARALLDETGEDLWAAAWRESAEALWAAREPDGLWTQRLYGEAYRGLGPAHGLVGNALALLRGGDLLAAERREVLVRDASAVLERTAVLVDGLASWPYREGGDPGKLQWCAGAPGIVISAAEYLDEELLQAGAELIWRAGPPGMAKGPGICHGTAGNGYALLKMFERTGDEVWLERARRFAVHALEQVERARAARGRGRYSLWTGDVGVALYAGDCLDARASYPVVDSWD